MRLPESIGPWRRIAGLAAGVLMTALLAGCGGSQSSTPASTTVPVPSVTGPRSASASDYPYLSQAYPTPATTNGTTLAANGYVEEEYFYSGTAHVYDWDSAGSVTTTYSGPYTNRMLIFRPGDKTKASGRVLLEILNSTGAADNFPLWSMLSDQVMQSGDIYVGISSKPVSIAALKTFNATRYASLSWANPVPEALRSATPGWGYAPEHSKPETQDGLVWDALSQAGVLLKHGGSPNPLTGCGVRKVYVGGQSQSGCLIQTYINAIQKRATLTTGAPIFDGYLQVVGSAVYQINQDDQAAVNLPGDPRLTAPNPVPLMRVLSQSDFSNFGLVQSLYGRRPDSDTSSDRFRLVEVPGANHGGNTIPLAYIVRGAYRNLDHWVRLGERPPTAGRILVDPVSADFATNEVLDTYGNALGGLRNPWVEVPIATYKAHNPDLVPILYPILGDVAYIAAWASGTTTYFGAAGSPVPVTPAEIYGSKANYLQQFNAQVDALYSGGWILQGDVQAIKDAQAAVADAHF